MHTLGKKHKQVYKGSCSRLTIKKERKVKIKELQKIN